MTEEIKKQLQKDYEMIVDFKSEWLKFLMKKYNLEENEVLNNIDF